MLLRVVAKAGQHDTRATNFVAVRIGESVGASIVVGGRLFGGSGSSAGEIGHLVLDLEGERCGCGNVGCVETIVAEHRSAERLVGVAASLSEALDEGPAGLFAVAAEQSRSARALRKEIGSIGTDLGTAIAPLIVLLDSERITNRRGAHESRAGAARCCYFDGTPTSAAVPGSTRRYPIQRTRRPRRVDRRGRSGLPLVVRHAMRDQHLVCSRASKRGSKRGPSARNPTWGRQERSGRTCGNL